MKKIIIFMASVIAFNSIISAQRVVITNDSLRVHFRKEKPYQVFEYYDRNHFGLDCEKLYYDEELKFYLLKWLDIDEYIEYKVDKYRKERIELMKDDDFSIVRVKDYIKNACKLNYDSICSIPELYAEYKEKTIEWLIEKEKERLLNEKDNIIPPDDVIYLHARISYPEAYLIIKQWEYKLRIPFIDKYGNINPYYEYLLKMNDPETQKQYDEIIKEFVKSNGYTQVPINIIETLDRIGYWDNAYVVEKLIEIYQVKRKYIPMETERSFDTDVLIRLLSLCEYNNIKTKYSIYSIDILDEKKLKKYSKEILDTSNKLVEKLKEKEKYWMDNMPFNNK
jgi:hypothetical protein